MSNFKVNLPESVIDEIEHYFVYIAQDSIQNALNWYQDIEEKIYTLDEFPSRCPVAYEDRFHDFEVRNLIFGEYRIIFRIQDKTVQVLHVKHGRLKREPLQD